eukprot:1147328-Rhodomonas_salina.1
MNTKRSSGVEGCGDGHDQTRNRCGGWQLGRLSDLVFELVQLAVVHLDLPDHAQPPVPASARPRQPLRCEIP